MVSYGFGIPAVRLPSEWIPYQSLYGTIARILYAPACSLVRISVLLFVRRMSPHSWIYYTTLVLLACNIAFAITVPCVLIFQCSPIISAFQKVALRAPGTVCINWRQVGLAIPLTSMLLDFIVWLIPVVMVLRMHFLTKRKKALVSILLGMGIVACFASIMRMWQLEIEKERRYKGMESLKRNINKLYGQQMEAEREAARAMFQEPPNERMANFFGTRQ